MVIHIYWPKPLKHNRDTKEEKILPQQISTADKMNCDNLVRTGTLIVKIDVERLRNNK